MLWVAEEQEGIWHMTICVELALRSRSFVSVRMASGAPASCEHPPSHSICKRESRACTEQFMTPSLDSQMPHNSSKTPTFYKATDMPCKSGPHSCTANKKSTDFIHNYMELRPFIGGIIE